MSRIPPDERLLSREDSLEYFIKFPVRNDDYAVIESEYSFVYNEANVPIVLLLGWAGCQDRYLMKYSKIYEDRGLITVRYTAPVETIFWKRDGMIPIGQKIVKLLYDMNFDSNPLIIHLFSNGGAYLYQHIDTAMKELHTPLNVCGIIFDSAPGDRRIMSLYRAISSIYGKGKRFNCITSWCLTFAMVFRWIAEDGFRRIRSIFRPTTIPGSDPYNILKHLDNYTPQLLLYSDTDKLIKAVDVEKFANHRQNKGVHVETICFKDAEHVKLYAKYPQMYIQSVCRFINECLTKFEFGVIPNKKSD